MKIGIIQATSQKEKNQLIFDCVEKAAAPYGYEVINFGVFEDTTRDYSYIEIAICVSLLLSSKAVDFIVTGCSSGQGMMLACNSLPGVICGYTPTPQDAFLFGRINGGNAASFPLGLNFGWSGEINLQCTIDKLFDGDFGTGYPVKDAERKRHDTHLLNQINSTSKRDWKDIIDKIDQSLLKKALSNQVVFEYIMQNSVMEEIKALMRSHR